jgi:hypothetical protein
VIKPGEEWGSPASSPPDLEISGSDADLAAAVSERPGILVRFQPDATSDLAGAVGIPVSDRPRDALGIELGIELALDLLSIESGPCAVNMILLGSPPDAFGRVVRRFGANVRVDARPVFHGPCTTIVIATGQFRNDLDLVPRGHPGDGRAELQVYAVPSRERRQLRARLATGTHVPHPDITQRSGSRVTVSLDRRVALEVDGRRLPATDLVDVSVVPKAYRLLV